MLVKSWKSVATRARHCSGSMSARSAPSTRIRPLVGWYSPHSSLTSVDFPAPFSPTSASVWPAGMSRQTPDSTGSRRTRVAEADVLKRDPPVQAARQAGARAAGLCAARRARGDRPQRLDALDGPARGLQQRQQPECAGDLHAHLHRERDHEHQVADRGVPVQRAGQLEHDGAAVAEREEALAERAVAGGLELAAPHRRGHLVPGAPLPGEQLVLAAEQAQLPAPTRCWSPVR